MTTPATSTPSLRAETVRLFGTAPDSIVDGPGLRYAIFVQGCSHHCPGCHNQKSQDPEGGTVVPLEKIISDIEANKLVHNVTLSGGEPFEQAHACALLAEELKQRGYGVWCYTGYLYEGLRENANDDVQRLLDTIDVLIDGPFVESLKSLGLAWRGSSNQRVIDMKATRHTGEVSVWEQPDMTLTPPANW